MDRDNSQFGRDGDSVNRPTDTSRSMPKKAVRGDNSRSKARDRGNRGPQESGQSPKRWAGGHAWPPQKDRWVFDADFFNKGAPNPSGANQHTADFARSSSCGGPFDRDLEPATAYEGVSARDGKEVRGQSTLNHNCKSREIEMQIPVADGPELISRAVEHTNISGKSRKMGRIYLISFIVAGLACALYYLFFLDDYRVSADLSYLCPDAEPGLSTGWSTEKEVLVLKSPTLFHLVAREMAGLKSSAAETSNRKYAYLGGFGIPARSGGPSPLSNIADSHKLIQWLSERLTVTPRPEVGMATISMTGTDPDLLKTVVTSYVKHYTGYRRALLEREQQVGVNRSDSAGADNQKSGTAQVLTALRSVDSQLEGCRLALQLMDSGTGAFTGFLPENNTVGIPALSLFQSKIEELEIKKRLLALRYQLQSREIRSIEQEIGAVRSAMKERLKQQQLFLEKRKQVLLTQKDSLESDTKRTAASSEMIGQHRDAQTGETTSQAAVQNCVHIQGNPFIAKKPLVIEAGEYAKAFFTGSISSREAPVSKKISLVADNAQSGFNLVSTTAGNLLAGLRGM